jgi:hypothetical protein
MSSIIQLAQDYDSDIASDNRRQLYNNSHYLHSDYSQNYSASEISSSQDTLNGQGPLVTITKSLVVEGVGPELVDIEGLCVVEGVQPKLVTEIRQLIVTLNAKYRQVVEEKKRLEDELGELKVNREEHSEQVGGLNTTITKLKKENDRLVSELVQRDALEMDKKVEHSEQVNELMAEKRRLEDELRENETEIERLVAKSKRAGMEWQHDFQSISKQTAHQLADLQSSLRILKQCLTKEEEFEGIYPARLEVVKKIRSKDHEDTYNFQIGVDDDADIIKANQAVITTFRNLASDAFAEYRKSFDVDKWKGIKKLSRVRGIVCNTHTCHLISSLQVITMHYFMCFGY